MDPRPPLPPPRHLPRISPAPPLHLGRISACTQVSLAWILVHLYSQPQLLDAARAELRTIPDLAGTDYVALSKLELVNSCIDEAVRH